MTACSWEYDPCPEPAVSRGMCKKHWSRVRRAELAGKPVYLDGRDLPERPAPKPKPEPVVTLTAAARPVCCERCGRPIAADDTLRADLIAAARRNHDYYCPGAAA